MENRSSDVHAVRSVLARWRESVNAGDADGLLALVTDDLEMIPPGEKALRGDEAHRFLRGFTDHGKANLRPFKDEEVAVSGDWAFQRYTYELTITPKDGNPVEVTGHGLHMFQRQHDGSWKLSKDMWSVVPKEVAAQNSGAVEAVRTADRALSRTGCVDKNLDAFLAFFDPTGSVMVANTPVATGSEAVRAMFAPFFSLPGFHCNWEPLHIEVAESGDLAYSRGTYRNGYVDPKGKAIEDRGSYLTIWRKDNQGKWRVVFDTFASEIPTPPN